MYIALLLEEKHETRPNTLKMSKFGETIDLNSASMWNKFSLTRFGVEFDRTIYKPLTALITDPRYQNPETETTDDFLECICFCCCTNSSI